MTRFSFGFIFICYACSASALDSVVVEKKPTPSQAAIVSIAEQFTLDDSLGINIGLLSEQDMQYITMACEQYTPQVTQCPTQLHRTIAGNLIEDINSHHAIGIFINSEKNLLAKLSAYQYKTDDNIVYDYGLGYNYFVNNTQDKGFNFAAHFYRYTDKRVDANIDNSGIRLQMGYQF